MRTFKTQYMLLAAVAGLLATGSSCKSTGGGADSDEGGPMQSVINVGEPRARQQIVSGFWTVENNAWRWTKRDFAVMLMPPAGAAQKGATLQFRFDLTEGLMARKKPVTISASVGSVDLPPQTYSEACHCAFVRDVPPAAFAAGGPVKVALNTDKYFPAGEIDSRELGVVASSIGLVAK